MAAAFRLMTANLLHEQGDPAEFARLLDRVSPDVVVTQELGPGCAEVIISRYRHHHLRPARDFTGRGLASRYESRFGDIPMPNRQGTWGFVNVDGRLVRIVGMHLANPIDFPWWTSVQTRTTQLESLFDWTASSDDDFPLVVAGDMNASPRWPAYRMMADRWEDLVIGSASLSGMKPERTWSWRPGWPRLLRIDHVFGLGVQPVAATTEPLLGSDHDAVVVDLEIPI